MTLELGLLLALKSEEMRVWRSMYKGGDATLRLAGLPPFQIARTSFHHQPTNPGDNRCFSETPHRQARPLRGLSLSFWLFSPRHRAQTPPGRLSNPRHHAVARSHGPLCAHRNLSGEHDRRVYDRYLGMFSNIPNIQSWSRDRPSPGLDCPSRNGFS